MTMKRSGRWTGPLWWAAAVVGSALMVLVAGVLPARLHAQSPDGPAPAAVDQAARDAVAAETGAAAEALTTLRAVLVTWNDACLGIVTPDLACAQVLTPGWVVWVGHAGAAYRVHTNHDGSASRVAPGTVEAATVADQPLPAGANVGEPVLILPPGGPNPCITSTMTPSGFTSKACCQSFIGALLPMTAQSLSGLTRMPRKPAMTIQPSRWCLCHRARGSCPILTASAAL